MPEATPDPNGNENTLPLAKIKSSFELLSKLTKCIVTYIAESVGYVQIFLSVGPRLLHKNPAGKATVSEASSSRGWTK